MIYLSVALAFVAVLARDAYRAHLKFQEAKVASNRRLDALEASMGGLQDRYDTAFGKQAIEVKQKVKELEDAHNALRKHIDSQVAGTIAQLPNTGRGFGR